MYVKLKNGNIYAAGPNENDTLFIYTLHKEKADGSFEKTEYGFKRKISLYDEDVEEYFELKWTFKLDVGEKGVPDEWPVTGDSDLPHGKVVLRFGFGNIPGWVQDDRGVCHKEYDFNLTTAWWVEKYTEIRNGVKQPGVTWVRTPVSKEEFVKQYEFYKSSMM